MKNLLREELERMLYLNKHKRGVIISEQISGELKGTNKSTTKGSSIGGVPSWKDSGGISGKIDFSNLNKLPNTNLVAYARDLTIDDNIGLNLFISRGLGKDLPQYVTITTTKPPVPPEKTPPQKTLISFQDTTFPYPDNLINPYFEEYPEAEDLFIVCQEIIVRNVELFGVKVLKKLIFKGSADSMRPTRHVPSNFKGKLTRKVLDHDKQVVVSNYTTTEKCEKAYCGIPYAKAYERNQFLADRRAARMAQVLCMALSRNKVFIDNNISYKDIIKLVEIEKGDNYYDGEKGRRGVKSVSITIVPSFTKFETSGSETLGQEGESETKVIIKRPRPQIGTITINNVEIPYLGFSKGPTGDFVHYIANNEQSIKLVGNEIPDFSVTQKLNNKTEVDGSIDGKELIIDGHSWGNLVEDDSSETAGFKGPKYNSEYQTICAIDVQPEYIEISPFKAFIAPI